MRTITLALLLLAPCMAACTLTPRDIAELNYPGFVDVGAGYSVAYNTRSGPSNDADGYLLSIKAYPFGRWYSQPKSTEAQALSQASEALVKSRLEAPAKVRAKTAEAKAHVVAAKERRAGLATAANPAQAVQECRDSLAKASATLKEMAPRQEWVASILEHLKEADEALAAPPAPAPAPVPAAPPAPAQPPPEDPLEEADKALDAQIEDLKKAEEGLASAITRLGRAHDELLNEELYEVQKGRDTECWWPRFYRRFSVFYGTSIDDFDGGGLDSAVNAVGVGFDVAPQFALLVGWGYYDVEDDAGIVDTDNGLVVGVSLNLNAFRWMFGDLTD